MAAQTEKICTIESVVFYVDPKSLGPLNFLGKERIRFPVTIEHLSLTVFKRKYAELAGLKAEAEKRPRFMHCAKILSARKGKRRQ